MKAIVPVALTAAFLFPSAARADGKADLEKMQGTWKLASGKARGKDLPAELLKTAKLIVEKDVFTIVHSAGGKERKSPINVKLDASKSPKQIDFVKDEKVDSHGIYKLEGKKLTFCFTSASGERPTKFECPEGSRVQLLIFEPPKKAKK